MHGGESRDILNVSSDRTYKEIDHFFLKYSMTFHAVKCRYLAVSAASHYIRIVIKHGVFFHTSSSNV